MAVGAAAQISQAHVENVENSAGGLVDDARNRVADSCAVVGICDGGSGGSGPNSMEIVVKNLEGQSWTLRVDASDTVNMVKQQIQEQIGLSAARQQLLLKKIHLVDDKTIAECGVQDLAVLLLLVKDAPAHYESDWCASEEGNGSAITLTSPRTAKAAPGSGDRGHSVRAREPMPPSGLHYFEVTYTLPHHPLGFRSAGGHMGACNNLSFGVVGPDVPPEIYSNKSVLVRLDRTEPQLHHFGSETGATGLFGISEVLDIYRGRRTGQKTSDGDKHYFKICNGDTVGILVNMDERALRVFYKNEQIVEIGGLPDTVYPVAAPYADGCEAKVTFPSSCPYWQ